MDIRVPSNFIQNYTQMPRFWATVYKTVHPVLLVRCLSCLSVMLVYCGQMVGWIQMKLGMEVGLSPILC